MTTTGWRLSNGVILPKVGLGTYRARGESLVQAIQCALDAGIEHIDTALGYRVRLRCHSCRDVTFV